MKKTLSYIMAVVLAICTVITAPIVSVKAVEQQAWIIAGSDAGIFGAEWDPGNTANQMTDDNGDGVFEKTYNISEGTVFDFKVTNGSWGKSYGKDGNNYTVTAPGGALTIFFDSNSKQITIESEGGPVVTADTYVVAGASPLFDPSWNGTSTKYMMTDNGNGTYSMVLTAVPVGDNYELKVVKNGSTWIPNDNVVFNVVEECDVTVTYTVSGNSVTVTGSGVTFSNSLEVNNVYVAGNGNGAWLNGVNWGFNSNLNEMKANGSVYTISYTDVAAGTYEMKFGINGGTTHTFGWNGNFNNGVKMDAIYNGGNIAFTVDTVSDINIELDLSDFEFGNKSGAKYKVTIEPVVEEPTTEEPTTEEPTTEEPTTEEPTTEEPTTEEPTTEEPTTEEPTTEEPTTEEPTTEEPTTEEPTTEEPTTEEPTTEEPTTEEPTTEEPTTEKPTTEEPTTEEPTTEEPTTEEPTTEEPTTEEPTTEEPTTEEPTTEEPTTEEPTTEEPTTEEPTTEEPTTEEPTTEEPTTEEPTTEEPTTEEPTTEEPTTEEPTTEEPTTEEPTTEEPTTEEPTTEEPTTEEPTTEEPTTEEPTTEEPTTEEPTTEEPTTEEPTTEEPTTEEPTTEEPTEDDKLPTGIEIEQVIAVGNGSETWLNGMLWDPAAVTNKMTASDLVYTITYTDVVKGSYELKFALNGGWTHSFGGVFEKSGAKSSAVYNGNNIAINVDYDLADITLELDLSEFDYDTKSGATFTVIIKDASPIEILPEISVDELEEIADEIKVDSVKVSDKKEVADIKANAEEKLKNATSDEEKAQLEAIIEKCDNALSQIEAATSAVLTEAVMNKGEIEADDATIHDVKEMKQAVEDLNAALKNYGGNYTAEETSYINSKIESLTEAIKAAETIEGSDEEHVIDSGKDLVFVIQGEFSKFKGFAIDGVEVDPSNYTLAEGSTIITLKASYLDTLEEGKHEIKAVYEDCDVDFGFSVAKETSEGPGDSYGVWIALALVLLSGTTAAIMFFRKKRRA